MNDDPMRFIWSAVVISVKDMLWFLSYHQRTLKLLVHHGLSWNGECGKLLVVTEYFSKLVEAQAFSQVTDAEVRSFIWKNVTCKFGVPNEIVTDNGTQFTREFCDNWEIKLTFLMPKKIAVKQESGVHEQDGSKNVKRINWKFNSF